MKNILRTFVSIAALGTPFSLCAETSSRIVETPLELTFLTGNSNYEFDETWPVEQAAREMTGIHLVLFGANSDDAPKSKSLKNMLEDDTVPDIVGARNLKPFVNEYGPVGAFMGMNELIEKHAPNLNALLKERPEIRSAIQAANGEIYYIPYLPDGKFGRGYFIRQDWLDGLGLKAPENVAELKQVLIAFRDRDPNGNGEQDEIPFFARNWQEMLRLLTLWDGRSTGSDNRHDFYVENGVLKHPYSGENYKEGIRNLSEWYAEGLIDPEIFSRGSKARDQLLSENLGGVTHDWFPSTSLYNTSLKDKIPGFKFSALLPPESVSGRRVAEHRRAQVKPDGWAIGYKNEHPIETIKYFDFWFSEEGRRLSNFGVEGQQYEVVDGQAVFHDDVIHGSEAVNAQLWAVGAQIPVRGYYQDYQYELQWSNDIALEGVNLYDQGDYLLDEYLGVALNEIEQSIFDRYWPRIQSHMLSKQKAWITGKSDVEKDWLEYVETLEIYGFSKVMNMMNSAYKRQYEQG